jgi:oligoendopeptidase F
MFEPKAIIRKFLPKDFVVTTWDAIKPYLDDLVDREINSLADFQRFLEDDSEIEAVISDDAAWRYIKKSCNTADKEINERFNYFITEISPHLSLYSDKLSKKITFSPFAKEVGLPGFSIVLGKLETANRLFREENIPLGTEIGLKTNEVNSLRGTMEVELDGEKMTIMQAEDRLFWNDRKKREEAWKAVLDRLFVDKDNFDTLFDEMFKLRVQQAKNAGFDNYRDYMFMALNRTDYTPEDCYAFHTAIKENVVPLIKEMQVSTKENLGVEKLYPWDLAVDPFNRKPLKAFDSENDFIEKSQKLFDRLDPFFSDCFHLLRDKKQLDLMSRPNKEPGGYNYPLEEKSIPFIFQNATEKVSDVTTLVHETGHAIHAISNADLPLVSLRGYPSEVAELASMSMEMFTMEYWDVYFDKKEDVYRAQREHLEDIVTMLAWMSIIDEFQHKLYAQKNPTIESRHALWADVIAEYRTGEVETENHIYGHFGRTSWLKQNHVFGMPFYYIDYGIAQLGALELWRNYKRDPKKTLQQYKDALKLGGTKSRPEVYRTAGASFDFSSSNIKELMKFIGEEIETIRQKEMAARETK